MELGWNFCLDKLTRNQNYDAKNDKDSLGIDISQTSEQMLAVCWIDFNIENGRGIIQIHHQIFDCP